MVEQILEILKIILPAIIVLISSYLIIKNFLVKEIEKKQLAIFQQNSDTSLKLRLQAYERLTIFIERLKTENLIGRFYSQHATAQDLQLAMTQSIRAELEHNVSQQLYVSHELWMTIRAVAEQEITMINRVGASLELGAPSSAFVKKLSDFVIEGETTKPSEIALETLNREAKQILFGS